MRSLLSLLALLFAVPAFAAEPPKLKLLFLGDNAGHAPATRFKLLQPVFAARNIELTYTDQLVDLNAKNLAGYDGLMIYANHTKIAPEQEKALLEFVASGKGFIPIHCASYCFLNSDEYVKFVGAQFRSHGTGTFRTEPVKADHPIMQGFQSFTSWDETYVHTKHNEKDRTVLEVRAEGELKEPWTWVRTPGKARVFYTAWGHDQRTWTHPGFLNLLERGTRWACGQDPALAGVYFDKPTMTEPRKDVKPFEYVPAKVPFYPPQRGGKANPITTMQKPLSVDESIKHYVTPTDFEVKVFVTEEKLGGKPIAMTWDEQGRLWVSITVDYPNEMQRPGEGRDRIVICEDANGDGVCDTVTTFADKLSIPTSLLPYAGGVIVHQAPVTLFLKDTNGDGKAEVRQELFRGWATNDTHAGPSNLHYGFDNWIYGSVGYAGYNGVVNGEKLNFRQGYYRFKIEPKNNELAVTKLEFLRSTSNNTWGLAFDESGNLFGSTANGCPLVHMPIPNRYYEKVKGLTPSVLPNIAADNHIEPITNKIRQVDWHGGFTAASNCSVYTARTYPREYWNRTAFVSEPTGHLTATFTLNSNGADFSGRYGWNLLASDDEWASPIDAQVGPDGHMWIIDWYNFIVQHNPTPAGFQNGKGNAYETPLRDKTHGRIYRVVYNKAKPEPRLNLKGASPEKLVETLKHHNMTWRLHAQRLLVERGNMDVIESLLAILADRNSEWTSAVHSIATLEGLGLNAIPPDILKAGNAERVQAFRKVQEKVVDSLREATRHPSAQVRRFAFAVLATDGLPASNEMVTPGLTDSDSTVRIAALLALADRGLRIDRVDGRIIERGESGTNASKPIVQALKRLENLNDPNVRVALTVAATVHADSTLLTFSNETFPPSALPIIETVAAASVRRRSGGDHIAMIFGAIIEADPAVREAIASGISAGWSVDKPSLTPKDEVVIGKALASVSPRSRAKLIKLVSGWGMKGLDAQLAEINKALLVTVANPKATDAERIEAAKQAIEFLPEDDAAALALLGAITPQTSPAVGNGILEALSQSKSKALAPAAVAKLKELSPGLRPAALRLVLARPDSAKAFLDAVEKGELRFDILELDQKTALANHPDRALAARAKKLLELGGGLPNADRQKVIEELSPLLQKTGDLASGKKVFLAQCAKCHKYAGEGTQIGPDLTGMAVHPKEELLIHIIDPSRSVEGNFKAYRVVTTDGRVIIGLLASESKTSVEIVDAEAKRIPLSRDDIESLRETDKSLMPEGFEKQVKPEEISDLLEFLTQKGKYVPIPLDKAATVVSTKDMFFDAGGQAERLVFPDWKPKMFKDVPFVLVDPQGEKVKNVVMLNGPQGKVPPTMPKRVSLPCNTQAKTIHLLSGIGGWSAQAPRRDGPVSMIVRLHYEDGTTEDHELKDGVHFADYIRRVDVPGSQFAFALRGQQVRYLSVTPKKADVIKTIELVKGADRSAPIVVAVTVETP